MTSPLRFVPASRRSRQIMLGLSLFLAGILGACETSAPVFVQSQNYNSRVNIVVLHYTVSDFEGSLNILTKPSSNPVSSHYLIPTPVDDSYPSKQLKLYQLVKETDRAWHAGKSYWGGRTTLNDMSIGIEIVNEANCVRPKTSGEAIVGQDIVPDQVCTFPPYPDDQIDILIELLAGIVERHPDIKPVNFVGHADIAPQRKQDPGPKFPWKRLAELGYGAWYDDDTVQKYASLIRRRPVSIGDVQKALHIYGYEIKPSGVLDEQTRNVLKAFQMHFYSERVSGEADVGSVARLYALIEKYRPKGLESLLKPQILAANTH